LTGSAFTLVAPEEEGSLRDIERAIGKRLPRVTMPDFDYESRPAAGLEVPHAQRIAEIRARKAEDRARARVNAERRAQALRRAGTAGARPGAGGQAAGQGGGGQRPRKPWDRRK
jgi:ATP-dependent RNA helicase RhlE